MRSAADDITLDDVPPRRRYPVPTPPPKQYTQEEMRELWRRAREIGPKLAEAIEQLNEALCTIEDLIMERLGKDARGRVELQRGETPIYEKRKKGKPGRLDTAFGTAIVERDSKSHVPVTGRMTVEDPRVRTGQPERVFALYDR